MMKNIALISTMMMVLLVSSGSALAIGDWVVGYVYDSADGEPAGDSYGRLVELCRDDTPADCLIENVGFKNATGVPHSGGTNPEEYYMFDCGLLADPCEEGDLLNIEVADDGSGYYAGPVQVAAAFPVQAPDMQLAADCTNTDSVLTVYTDDTSYYQGEDVTVTAHFEDDACEPIVGTDVGIQVNQTNGTLYYFCQETTNSEGNAICVLGLAGDAEAGTWTVDAAFGGYSDDTTFDVLLCDGDEDGSDREECVVEGEFDCDDADPTSYPGAQELCDSIDNDCDLGIDEDFTNLGDACSAGTGACARGGVFVCSGDMLSSVCDAVAGSPGSEICGNGIDENCDGSDAACSTGGGGSYSPGGGASVYCGNLFCDVNEDCESCPRDCGECPPVETDTGGDQCVPDWECGEWTECSPDGSQTRECNDLNECEGTFVEPETEQNCVYTAPAAPEPDGDGDGVTGLFLGDPAMSLYWMAIVVMVVLGAGVIFWRRRV